MQGFVCPKCFENLIDNGKSLICTNNHCFDIAKSGYVNLLQNNQSGAKRHGDDKLMVKARTDFLNKGYYDRLIETVAELVNELTGNSSVILDAGCGECKYTDAIENKLLLENKNASVLGVDISKDAINIGAKRNKRLNLAVAGANKLPVANESLDVIVNIFAPSFPEEFLRTLKQNGKFIKVVPLSKHLFELKQAIYDNPYLNEVEDMYLDGFEIGKNLSIEYEFALDSNEDINNLFMMTPYYYKTSVTDQDKIKTLNSLKVTAHFGIIVYNKK